MIPLAHREMRESTTSNRVVVPTIRIAPPGDTGETAPGTRRAVPGRSCLSTLGLTAIMLIVVLFVLDVVTLCLALNLVSREEAVQGWLTRIQLHLEYKSHMPLSAEQRRLLFGNETEPAEPKHRLLRARELAANRLARLSEHRAKLMAVIVVSLVALAIHLIGLVGVLRQSFTLTLFETLFLIILVLLKPSIWLTDLGWIIWILYAACLPLFLLFQLKLYRIKVKHPVKCDSATAVNATATTQC